MRKRFLFTFLAWCVVLWPVGVPAAFLADAWWAWPLAAALLTPLTVVLHERSLRRQHGAGWKELERKRREL